MIRCLVLACLVVAGGARGASANGRPPGTSSITFRQGHETDVAVGLTFGLVVSHDGGATWVWTCEDAIGYSGMYDPRYAFSSSGSLFATTLTGLKVERDSCTFNPAAASPFVSTTTLGLDQTLYYTSTQGADSTHTLDYGIYKSIDDGASFALTPGQPDGPVSWWETLTVAPANQQVVYLTGYVYVAGPGGVANVRQQLVFRSDDGGSTWAKLALDTSVVTVMANSTLEIVGITQDEHLYMRATLDDNIASDSLYRSTDRGAHWQRINHKATAIPAFVVRAAVNSAGTHDLIVGTPTLGAEISHDDGATWTALASAPHMTCLVENAAGELWACTQNYGTGAMDMGDGAGIMKTTDPETGPWTKVLRYQDLTDAATCPAGTRQQVTCVAGWCALCAQLGCKPSESYHCPVASEAPSPAKSGGCCDGGGGGTGALALGLPVGMVLLRPRRRRVK